MSRPTFMSFPRFLLIAALFIGPGICASGATTFLLMRHHHHALVVALAPVWMLVGWMSGQAWVEHFRDMLRRRHRVPPW